MNLILIKKKITDLSNSKTLILLVMLSVFFQAAFLLANPIGFECDAAMFYNYAKAIIYIGRSASDYRPPGFPLFLLVTGQIWPGTFLFTLLFQSAMAVLMPILVYKVLKYFGNVSAIFGSLFTIFSTITYNYSTLMLSDQLFGFTFLLAIYFFSNYYFLKKECDLKWFLLVSLICTFTRWEGIFLLINGMIYVTFYYCKSRRYKSIGILILSILLIFLSYTVVRAAYFKDIRMIGSLQNGSGSQLLFRIYGADYSRIIQNDKKSESATTLQSLSNVNRGLSDKSNSVQYFQALNGENTKKLIDIVENFASTYPDSFRKRKDSILNLPISNLYENSYETLYGRFDGHPRKLAEHIFTAPSNGLNSQYVFYVDSAVKSSLGVVDGNRLLIKASIEAMVANPVIIFAMLNESMSILGIDIVNFLSNHSIKNTLYTDLKLLFPYWGKYHYAWLDFDLGKCATNALSHHMIEELKFSYSYSSLNFNDHLTGSASFNRNMTRAFLGFILILFGWILLFSKNKFYIFVLFASFIPMMITYGVFIGGAYTRYEVATLPILIIIVTQILLEFQTRCSNFFRK